MCVWSSSWFWTEANQLTNSKSKIPTAPMHANEDLSTSLLGEQSSNSRRVDSGTFEIDERPTTVKKTPKGTGLPAVIQSLLAWWAKLQKSPKVQLLLFCIFIGKIAWAI